MIRFTNLKNVVDDSAIELHLRGIAGRDIDGTKRPGQVTLYLGDDKNEELAVIDLELPMARALAAALVELCRWTEQADIAERRKRKGKD